MFLLGCLPLWGREGVTLIAFFKRMMSDRISTGPKLDEFTKNYILYTLEVLTRFTRSRARAIWLANAVRIRSCS